MFAMNEFLIQGMITNEGLTYEQAYRRLHGEDDVQLNLDADASDLVNQLNEINEAQQRTVEALSKIDHLAIIAQVSGPMGAALAEVRNFKPASEVVEEVLEPEVSAY